LFENNCQKNVWNGPFFRRGLPDSHGSSDSVIAALAQVQWWLLARHSNFRQFTIELAPMEA